MATFREKDVVIAEMKSICDAHPDNVTYWVAGHSYRGRSIYVFAFGNPNAGRVLFDGSLHGWEDYGTEVFIEYARWLLESGSSTAQWILQNVYTLIVPVLNMDNPNNGDAEVPTNTTMSDHRQNSNKTDCSYGTDLNRNFPNGWSANTCGGYPNTYHGKAAASEPETQTILNLLDAFRPAIYLNTHIGGCYCNGAGNTTELQKVKTRYQQLCNEMGQTPYSMSLSASAGSGMAYGAAAAYGALGFLNEMADESGNPFSPDTSGSNYGHTRYTLNTIKTKFFNKCLPMYIAFSEYAADSTTPPPTYECPYCSSVFNSQSALDAHVAAEHQQPVYKCPICGEEFTSQAELDAHVANAHPVTEVMIDSVTVVDVERGVEYTWFEGQDFSSFAPQIAETSHLSVTFTSNELTTLKITDRNGVAMKSTTNAKTLTWASTNLMGTGGKTFNIIAGTDTKQLAITVAVINPATYTITVQSSPVDINMTSPNQTTPFTITVEEGITVTIQAPTQVQG